jgi:elongation factor G
VADKEPDLGRSRNLGIIAHIDAGKTTTSEHILYYAGATHSLGGVDEGSTETDFDEEERKRGITIYSACIPFQWLGHTVNLIDTPGHIDFTAEVERSLRVLDGCVVVFDAQKGVEAQSETVWRQADKYDVPRMVFVNKMDVVGANYGNVLDEVRQRLDANPVPITIPIGYASPKDSPTPFCGIIDLLQMKAVYYDAANKGKTFRTEAVPEALRVDAMKWRERLFDTLTQNDESDLITSALLEGTEPDAANLKQLIREQTLKRLIQPVFAGSGREHIGVQPLLDGAVWFLPSPLDRPPVVGVNPKKPDKKETRRPDLKEPFAGLVFKIVGDDHGELFFVRIYSGVLKHQSRPYNPGKDVKEMVSKIYHTKADPKDREELASSHAGDIVALIGMRDSITGDTLCDMQHPILLERISFREPVVSKSVEPESSGDKQKLIDTLNRMGREDPTFTWKVDPETGQTLMNGMGVLHLEIKQHKMERDFRLKVRVGKPLVSYRETLKKAIKVEGECVRQTGEKSLFAKVRVEMEPHSEGESIQVVNKLKPDTLPPLFVVALERGLRGALQSGEIGYPVMNVKATVVDAQMDQELSSEIAFEAAGADAVHKAMRDNIVLLEPIMRVEVTVPNEFIGPVMGDLTARRADIDSNEQRGSVQIVHARVALSQMFDYTEKVRSLSQGRASPSMEPHAYAPAPDEVLKRLLNPEDYY